MGSTHDPGLQHQIDALVEQVTTNSGRIAALQDRADQFHSESLVDREMIAELQADGILSRDHVAQLEKALTSSRCIGAAIGILMASRQVPQDRAFELLKESSQRANRKLYDVAAELVESVNHGVGEGPSPA